MGYVHESMVVWLVVNVNYVTTTINIIDAEKTLLQNAALNRIHGQWTAIYNDISFTLALSMNKGGHCGVGSV